MYKCTGVHTHTHTHIYDGPDLAKLQMPNFKHINRPIECKIAFRVFIMSTYTFPEWGEAFIYIFISIFIVIFFCLCGWLRKFG